MHARLRLGAAQGRNVRRGVPGSVRRRPRRPPGHLRRRPTGGVGAPLFFPSALRRLGRVGFLSWGCAEAPLSFICGAVFVWSFVCFWLVCVHCLLGTLTDYWKRTAGGPCADCGLLLDRNGCTCPCTRCGCNPALPPVPIATVAERPDGGPVTECRPPADCDRVESRRSVASSTTRAELHVEKVYTNTVSN